MSKIDEAQRILQESGLPPGKHHDLQIAIIKSFGPHFTPDSTVLYLGDAGNKSIIYEKEMLEELGVPVTTLGKLPDTMLYNDAKNLLFLIEAITSHGPITPERLFELEKQLQNCIPGRIYISAFLDFTQYEQHMLPIAWDTHVWIAEIPEHMIHYNGDRYMGQHG
jgi:BsuBI/PstI restriction endonuclease